MRQLLSILLSIASAISAAGLVVAQGAPPAQAEAGIPLIRSFPLREFGGTSVVDMAQGPSGLLYLSDYNRGLFEYDGELIAHYKIYIDIAPLYAD